MQIIDARPRAIEVFVTDDALTVELEDGRTISVPLSWHPRVVYGTQGERLNFTITGGGSGIHWPDLDEDFSVEGLLMGKKSTEGSDSIGRWLAQRNKTHI